ncbi:hypothetical protein K9U39_15015 [Rhodoblastus acidophilus]|uniref:Uncharacterized protein n=1 Tax=Candidatus Rhodoblastus alkanivorans TaxID=2954117 RepID=A0ABS9Z0P2_9HYPH|nr:hypothetical protein [Candidatus Rhodoblastus alkanivorans]MCI4678142.1 hypothetical protein [Candidatus Rhodoblastus alkanivorans]MCI4681192.1 hypothetical protein [Candidatus Rhodoblastus alkanivorans]MDI4642235.1 hypothetical protein [Rhodoblastus acidophilus]
MFWREKETEQVRLYRVLRGMERARLSRGAAAGGDFRFVAYSRGCGGGTSFLVREETADGACRAYAILATYEPDGVEESSFGSAAEALAFVARAVEALRRR